MVNKDNISRLVTDDWNIVYDQLKMMAADISENGNLANGQNTLTTVALRFIPEYKIISDYVYKQCRTEVVVKH